MMANGQPKEPGKSPEGAAGVGPSTLAVHAGIPAPVQGEPLRPGPVFAAPFHLRGAVDSAPYGYGRDGNPSWTALETALGELEAAEAVVFASGMAAAAAVLEQSLQPGDGLVLADGGYCGVRLLATERLVGRGVDVRVVAPTTAAIAAACSGARLVWIETPSNPGLEVCDIAAVADAAHAAGARLVADNTLATPLGQRPLDHGADAVVYSATKALAGHSDIVLGSVSVRDPGWAARLRDARARGGAVPGPFEAWLAHRSLATLALRLERSSANALALAQTLRGHPDVLAVVHPWLEPGQAVARRQMRLGGPVLGLVLDGAQRAQRFLAASELIAEATSFGGVHSTAERRARWGSDAVPAGFIRWSAGIEDLVDLVADAERALARAHEH